MYSAESQERLGFPYMASIPLPTLQRWTDRSEQAIKNLKKLFPKTPIRWRTLHPLWPGTEIDFWNNIRIAQINEASRQVAVKANVPLLDLGHILTGLPTEGLLSVMQDKVSFFFNVYLYLISSLGAHGLDALSLCL